MTNVNVKKQNPAGAAKRSIRSKVVNALIENHSDEFDALMAVEYKKAGFTYVRPLTAEEKAQIKATKEYEAAKEQYDALIEKYPTLAGVTAAAVAVDDEEFPTVANLGIDPSLSRS